MDLNQYSESVENTRHVLQDATSNCNHMLFGMMTELGELVDIFKKGLAYGQVINAVDIKEELGDMMYYIQGMCNVLGIDLGDVLQLNSNKLEARYPEKFTQFHAMNRDLDKERKVLEGNSTLEVDEEFIDW